jgi:hypothetical protein
VLAIFSDCHSQAADPKGVPAGFFASWLNARSTKWIMSYIEIFKGGHTDEK